MAHLDIAMYSASVVESATHFCVLENQLIAAPLHFTTLPDDDLRSVALLAKSASANTLIIIQNLVDK